MKFDLTVFEDYKIRRVYDEASETWFFSVIDIVAALTDQPDYNRAKTYWTTLKNRLKNEGSEAVTKCDQLKMLDEESADIMKKLKLIIGSKAFGI